MHDPRAQAFATLVCEGIQWYTYVARTAIPGTFAVPPAKAEEMYSPEVFGRSSGYWVIVESRRAYRGHWSGVARHVDILAPAARTPGARAQVR